MSPKQQRLARLYQGKCRGDRRSYKTDAENLGLLLLWEAEVLSEGQVAKALDIDRVTLRMMREGAIAEALKLAEALVPAPDLTRTPNIKAALAVTGSPTGLEGLVMADGWRAVDPDGTNVGGGCSLEGWLRAVRWTEAMHGIAA